MASQQKRQPQMKEFVVRIIVHGRQAAQKTIRTMKYFPILYIIFTFTFKEICSECCGSPGRYSCAWVQTGSETDSHTIETFFTKLCHENTSPPCVVSPLSQLAGHPYGKSCGVGQCNMFHCNCDGGCRPGDGKCTEEQYKLCDFHKSYLGIAGAVPSRANVEVGETTPTRAQQKWPGSEALDRPKHQSYVWNVTIQDPSHLGATGVPLVRVFVPPLANVAIGVTIQPRAQQKWTGSEPMDWLEHQSYGWNVNDGANNGNDIVITDNFQVINPMDDMRFYWQVMIPTIITTVRASLKKFPIISKHGSFYTPTTAPIATTLATLSAKYLRPSENFIM
uniref:Uncharacterized protein n=1 Tax=Romanomermis culicivorax TaxID=13658 RepID=A0A915JKY4_ROMCU